LTLVVLLLDGLNPALLCEPQKVKFLCCAVLLLLGLRPVSMQDYLSKHRNLPHFNKG
jgi:hypothetical protein